MVACYLNLFKDIVSPFTIFRQVNKIQLVANIVEVSREKFVLECRSKEYLLTSTKKFANHKVAAEQQLRSVR